MFHLSMSSQPFHNLRNIWITKILSLFLYSNTGRLGEASCCGIPAPFDWGFPQSRLANRRMERVYRETILGERWTTNDTESWHRRLKAIILKSHPTVESFCSDLMGEWGFISMMIEMVLAEHQRKIWLLSWKRESAVFNVLETDEDYNSIIDYFDTVAKATKKK